MLPGLVQMLLNIRLANVIENELGVGTLRHEFDRVRQVRVRDANLKMQTIIGQGLHALHKIRNTNWSLVTMERNELLARSKDLKKYLL